MTQLAATWCGRSLDVIPAFADTERANGRTGITQSETISRKGAKNAKKEAP